VRLDAQALPVLYDETDFAVDDGFRIHASGGPICLIATGYMVHTALKVAQIVARAGVAVGIIDLFDISGFDEDKLAEGLRGYHGVMTLEEGFAGRGGLDAMVFDWVARRALPLRIRNVGVSGGYRFEIGSREQLHEQVGIGVDAVSRAVTSFVASLSRGGEVPIGAGGRP
jgi:transketolase